MSGSFEWGVTHDLRNLARRQGKMEGRDIPALYLPWTQRVLNPFPLASSGNAWGDQAIPWPVRVLAFYVAVFVSTTNNGTNFWTIQLIDQGSNVMASMDTSGIPATSWRRLQDLTITQSVGTNPEVGIVLTATLSPGSIYLCPALPLLRVQ